MRIVHVVRKPCSGSVAACLIAHGTGALHIDGTRVGTDVMTESRMRQKEGGIYEYHNMRWEQKPNENPREHIGRWPANAILQESAVTDIDLQSGDSQSVSHTRHTVRGKGTWEERGGMMTPGRVWDSEGYSDSGGASRFFKQVQ